tara:strand:+ start:404 stop:682 length:279 start_codon:yes stop_codon:yes gene_type:complete
MGLGKRGPSVKFSMDRLQTAERQLTRSLENMQQASRFKNARTARATTDDNLVAALGNIKYGLNDLRRSILDRFDVESGHIISGSEMERYRRT